MPVYEYVCDDCGLRFSKLVASHRSKPECKSCGSKKLSRQFSTFAAHGGGSKPECPAAGMGCPSQSSGGCAGGGCPFSG